ncbi:MULTISPECIES: DUF1033 family protein [Sporosarcina]|uniref:DUF1033 family protein n=1 Tax=Sporosarcina TaxID=1569 RepID=UPI00129B84A3|nr:MULTISPECIES: DUF1033 family protein [Sporosarcina]GKV65800.1 superoxide dismutase [Sporosarcina sp. NCCP-2331]GLB55924.1 superoxide dismutase [Sporosarcina sp. NCCP-2378]
MYEVVYMKADFEPWWMFEEWRDFTVSSETFLDEKDMQQYLNKVLTEMEQHFERYEARKGCFHAFWSASEKHYCDGCEGDLQIYHGIVVLHNDQPCIS